MLSRAIAIADKEIRQLSRDRLTFGMIIGIPLLQMLLFGYAINYDVRDLRTGVVDEARSSRSRALIQDLEATGAVKVTGYGQSINELRARIRAGEFVMGVYIPPDLERRYQQPERPLAQLLVDGSEPTIEGIAGRLASMPLSGRAGLQSPDSRVFAVLTEFNPEKRTAVQIVPALIGVILTMTMVMFTAVAIVRERERGNLELLITTPVSTVELMVGKLLPYVFIGFLQATLVLVAGSLLFDVPVNGRLTDLYLAVGLFIAATLTLGLLISTIAKTQMQAFQMSVFVLLPSILLSGFMFPFDGMPKAAQWLAQLLPLTHFNVLIRGIVLRGAELSDMGPDALKLVAFLIITLILAVLRFHKRLD
jgi:ABC-2 type transport system permease protein